MQHHDFPLKVSEVSISATVPPPGVIKPRQSAHSAGFDGLSRLNLLGTG